jgi:CRISPR system Cascade subunit CasA
VDVASVREVGLRDALVWAHEIEDVADDSPFVVVALLRLLQALALDIALGVPGDRADDAWEEEADARWWACWEAGRFDPDAIDAYFDAHADRFDLFDPERPFMQHPEPLTKQTKSPAVLAAELASGNNPTIFDHALDADATPLTPAQAARGVVATQATAIGGGKSRPFYYSDAIYVGGAVFWVHGASLFESLMLNTPPSDSARMKPLGVPYWRRATLPRAQDEPSIRNADGYLDYLTWPARRLLLLAEEHDGRTLVTGVKISQGDKLDPKGSTRDPLMAYQHSEKTGSYPYKLREDRSLWRDANVFLRLYSEAAGGAPRTVEWALMANDEISEAHRKVDVFGLANDKADIKLWRRERMTVYRAVLADADRQEAIQLALKRAEKQGSILFGATRACATQLLYPGRAYRDLNLKQQKDDVRRVAKALGTDLLYWSSLEAPFLAWLSALAHPEANVSRQQAEWTRRLHTVARAVYREATRSLDGDTRQARARAAGRTRLAAAAPYRDALKA